MGISLPTFSKKEELSLTEVPHKTRKTAKRKKGKKLLREEREDVLMGVGFQH